MKITILLGAALVMLAAYGCSGDKQESQVVVERAVSVQGTLVAESDAQLTKNFTGTIEGEKQAVLSAKISEAVEKVLVKEGDFVKTDDVLIMLDRKGSSSNYMQASSVFQNAEKNYNKMKFLYDEGAVSESQYDGARTEYEVARANFEAARQLVEIKSPINGMVTSTDVSAGDYLYPGQTVATVASVDRLRIKLGVSGNDIGLFSKGSHVKISIGSSSPITADGKVYKVAQSADPATRTFAVEIEIDNSAKKLKPGMFGRAAIVATSLKDIIVIPRSAVISGADENFVFVAANSHAQKRIVKLGVDFDGTVEILEGLNQGDTLVTVGQNYLDDGRLLKVVRLIDENGEEIKL
ncbi:MAG: efflux RND transporter periplasmic adaptor subunit [Candidatus Zixiibacteriota bacterium]